MPRILIGWLLVGHAFAHAAIGLWVERERMPALIGGLWVLAVVGFLAAGLGVLRVPVVRHRWKQMLIAGSASSSLLCLAFAGWWGIVGFLINMVLTFVAGDALQRRIDADVDVVDALGTQVSRHPRWLRAGWVAGTALIGYVAVVAMVRPVYLRWGTTAEERTVPLAGDDVLSADARYRVDHAITIHAPPSAVWPWLLQLGQDRGGFYSYDWLERAFGVGVRNADRIHPEWQHRAVGDTVYATQASYGGGRLGKMGWRITAMEPDRVMVLEGWGAFVLRPLDEQTTRLIVRARGPGTTNVVSFVASPFTVFVFEPAHFIMQRAMLRGIRDRAERAVRANVSLMTEPSP